MKAGLGTAGAASGVAGQVVRVTKVGERSAPFTGRPPTQPSRRPAAAHGAATTIGFGSNLASGSCGKDFGTILAFTLSVVGGLAAVHGVVAINGFGSSLARSFIECGIGVALGFSVGLNNWIKATVGYGGGALGQRRCAR